MRPHTRTQGGPLLRVKRADLAAVGVERIEDKVTGTADGKPVLAEGLVLDVASVGWCTGSDPDLSWIEVPVAGADGWPVTERGVVTSCPGLYFAGVPFLFGFRSMLLTGVGRDAQHVVPHIRRRTASSSQAEDAVAA